MSIGLEKLFVNILDMSIMASYCIAAVFLLRWLFRKAPKRYTYLLWLVAAFRLVCPLSVDSSFSFFNLVPEAGNSVEAELSEWDEFENQVLGENGDVIGENQNMAGQPDGTNAGSANLSADVNTGSADQSSGIGAGANTGTGIGADTGSSDGSNAGTGGEFSAEIGAGSSNQSSGTNMGNADQQGDDSLNIQDSSGQKIPDDPASGQVTWTTVGSWIWVGGITALAGLMLISWIRLKLHVRTAIRLRDNVYEAEGIDSPFVMGVIRPKVYLPINLGEKEQEWILLHENCHIRRKDYLVKMLASVLTVVYWFNPLVWAAWFGFCRDMEMSCDEMALDGADDEMRKEYSRTLLAVASDRPFSWQMPPAFGENDVKGRVKHVLSFKKPAIWAGAAFAVILAAVWVIFGTDGKETVSDNTPSVSDETDGTAGEEDSTQQSQEAAAGGIEAEVLGLLREEGKSAILVDGNRFENASAVYEADIDHDGEDEYIVVERFLNEERKGGVTTRQVSVVKDQQVVWDSASVEGDREGLFLYEKDGEDYFVVYDVENGRTYRFLQFYLDSEYYDDPEKLFIKVLEDYDVLTLDTRYYQNLPLDGEKAGRYVEQINDILSHSTLLYWDTDVKGYLSPEEESGRYIEDLSEVFSSEADFADCQTVEEKVERLNQLTMEKWFPDGELPAELAALSTTISEKLAPYLGEPVEKYAKIAEDRARWFADYNGEKLQLVESYDGSSVEIIYYRAEEGETVNDAAMRMLEAMYEQRLNVETSVNNRPFKMTDYLMVEQNLRDNTLSTLQFDTYNKIIREYCEKGMKSKLTTDEELTQWIDSWIEGQYGENGQNQISALPEDMWVFLPKGYYKYEGCSLVTFMDEVSYATTVVDGMVPFYYQGGEGVFDYILMKYGNVYRLQKARQWETTVVADGKVLDGIVEDYQIDIDHDGQDEQLYVQRGYSETGTTMQKLWLVKNGNIIWKSDDMFVRSNGYSVAYFLYSEGGNDYLVKYTMSNQEDSMSSDFRRFYLTADGAEMTVTGDSLSVYWNRYSENNFPLNAEKIAAYADEVNAVLGSSIMISSDMGGALVYSTAENRLTFREDMSALFGDEVDYSSCETIAEKVAVLNRALLDKWFVDGEIPEMPEEFITLMTELMNEVRPNLNVFETLMITDRSVLFADYNGEKLQFIDDPEYEVGTPVAYPGKIYYRADEGQSLEEVVEYMLEALLEHLMNDFQDQEFVITDYRIEEQSLTSWEDIVESNINRCWVDYLEMSRGVMDNLMEYTRSWVEERFSEKSNLSLGLQDEMWYFGLDGYYRYEGGHPTFEERASWGQLVGGMVSMQYGDGMNSGFVLVKYGDVYGLQLGYRWG